MSNENENNVVENQPITINIQYNADDLAGFDVETLSDLSRELRASRSNTIDAMIKWALGEVAVDGASSPIDAAEHLIRSAANARYYGLVDLPHWDIVSGKNTTRQEETVNLLVRSAVLCMMHVRLNQGGSQDPKQAAEHDIQVLKDRVNWSSYRRVNPRSYANRAGLRVLSAGMLRLS